MNKRIIKGMLQMKSMTAGNGIWRITVVVLSAVFCLAFIEAADEKVMGVVKGSVKPGTFGSPEGCMCHNNLRSQWAQSMHAKALDDPLYQAVLAKAKKEAGDAVGEYCETCHAPGAMMMGTIDSAKGNIADSGITCSFCHQVTAQTAKVPGNTSLGFPQNGPDGVFRAQIADHRAPHPAGKSELLSSAEFCGACHNVNHPFNGVPLEATYTEWKESSYAKDGVTCQNCHMGPAPGVRAPYEGVAAMGAPTRDNMFAMTFTGANVGQGNADAARALLESAASIRIEAPEIIAPGTSAKAKISVTNSGAGHSLPTGLTEVRRMWLDISLVSADGTGKKLDAQEFITILNDGKGKTGVDVWDAAGIESDIRIKAGETYTREVTVEMPRDAAERKRLVATLNYQSYPDELARAAGVENPTTKMASSETEIYPGGEAK
jgi:hypothetical protein